MYQGMDTGNAAPAGVSAMGHIVIVLVAVEPDIPMPVFIVGQPNIVAAIRFGIITYPLLSEL